MLAPEHQSLTSGARREVEEMVRRIVSRFDPERIMLFGSCARGTAGLDSDADLLVVIQPRGTRRQQATAIDVALLGIGLSAP